MQPDPRKCDEARPEKCQHQAKRVEAVRDECATAMSTNVKQGCVAQRPHQLCPLLKIGARKQRRSRWVEEMLSPAAKKTFAEAGESSNPGHSEARFCWTENERDDQSTEQGASRGDPATSLDIRMSNLSNLWVPSVELLRVTER